MEKRPDCAYLRAQLAEKIKEAGIRDERVIEAIRRVPRHAFIPEHSAEVAYEDRPLPIGAGQTISQPYIVALMTQEAQVTPTDRVLEIGTGSGYAAAVMSHIARDVYTVERLASLATGALERLAELGYENVHVRCGDGTLGWDEHAPYDAIVVTAGGPGVPDSLRRQLAVGGRLVIPVGDNPSIQTLVRVVRESGNRYRHEELDYVRFVALIGAEGWGEDTGTPSAAAGGA